MRCLVFRLHGPLAAWGEAAPGEVRPTNLHPTRSALLGLLAGAVGLDRRDEAGHRALGESLLFGVRVLSAGVPLADYHTAQLQKPSKRRRPAHRPEQLKGPSHKLMTVLSQRYYRCDALAEVAAWHPEGASPEERFSLDALAAALERPHFVPYLGRKSCPPSLPFAPRVLEGEVLEEAFGRYQEEVPLAPADRGLRFLVQGNRRRTGPPAESPAAGLFWEGPESAARASVSQRFERRDDPVSRTRRTFRARWEHFAPAVEVGLAPPEIAPPDGALEAAPGSEEAAP